MPRIYFYKLIWDGGGAPCVENNLLSLAICKPGIRSTASRGDLIFGFAADSLHPDNPLIYAARVTDKLINGLYYKEPTYTRRGDAIYQFTGNHFEWKQDALHHRPEDLEHDLGKEPNYKRANVLLSTNFRYLGNKGSSEYKLKFPRIKQAVESLGIGHRVNHTSALQEELILLEKLLWETYPKPKIGQPMNKPSRSICYRK